jgi:hypothetical protein
MTSRGCGGVLGIRPGAQAWQNGSQSGISGSTPYREFGWLRRRLFLLGCGNARGEENYEAQQRSRGSLARTREVQARCFQRHWRSLDENF